MSEPMVLLRAGGQSITFQNPREKLQVLEKAIASPCLESQVESQTAVAHKASASLVRTYPLGIPLDYFNTSLQLFPLEALAVSSRLAYKQAQPTILQSAEWIAFQAACEQAAVELAQSLDNLEHSRTKGYLLGEEKKNVQAYLRVGLEQVQVVCQIINEITRHPTEGNWQRLQLALEKLTEISAMAAPAPASPAGEINAPRPTTGLARAWEEVQYSLGPVIVTGWSVLSKLGMFTEALAKNVPIVGGLTSLMLTLYQRIIVRIRQLKTEDQDQLIAVCHVLTTAFDQLKGHQMLEQIQAQTNNTVIAAQGALDAAHQAGKTKKEVIELRAENDRLIKLVQSQKIQIEALSVQLRSLTDGQQHTNTLLAALLKQKNEVVEKKA